MLERVWERLFRAGGSRSPRGEPGPLKIVAGLGNPGRTYGRTRHNAGWMALDKLAERCGVRREEDSCNGVLARCGQVWLFKPLTFMNRSGPPVARLLAQAVVGVQDLLVLVDDLNLPLGTVRLRPGGTSGGHRGLGSLIEALGTEEFARLRMGIGPYPTGQDAREFVLSRFAPDEEDVAKRMTDLAADAALCWVEEGLEAAMNRFNRNAEN